MVKEVLDILKQERPTLAPVRVWEAYERIDEVESKPVNELTALIALIRRVISNPLD